MMHSPAAKIRQERSTLFQQQRGNEAAEEAEKRRRASTSATASEAASIQQSLARTQRMLKVELDRVDAVHHALTDDEKLLKETLTTHKTLNVKGAKKALTALERAQQKERRILTASLVFFWTVVFYVVWCRILVKIPFVDRLPGLLALLTRTLEKLIRKITN
jgi:hypothetical protein